MLELLGAAFGRWPRGIRGVGGSEFFNWKHMESPYGPSSLLVAEAGGSLVGFLAYMRWRFRAGGRTFETMRGVDFALHPDRRRRGASSALTRAAIAHFPDGLAFVWGNPNAQGTPVSVRSGWHDLGAVPRFIRPRARLLAALGRSAEADGASPAAPVAATSAADLLRDGDFVSHLLGKIREPEDRLVTERSLDYLRWRYGRFGEYRAVRTDPADEHAAVAIFRQRRHGRLSALDVCEVLADPAGHRAGQRALARALEAAPSDLVSLAFPSRLAAGRRGFIGLPRKEVLVAYPLTQNGGPDPTRRSSWTLSRGDLELL